MSQSSQPLPLGGMVAFEYGLAAGAILIGWFVGFDPLQSVPRGPEMLNRNLLDIAIGCALAFPLLGFFIGLERFAKNMMDGIRDVLMNQIAPAMSAGGWAGRALVSLAAGVGEEVLFRGLIQGGLAQPMGPIPALVVASLIFGAMHWVNVPYFVCASAIGVLLGGLFLWTGSLVAPIVLHAVYDFLALNRLAKEYEQSLA